MKEKLWTRNFILLVMASLGSGFLVSLFLNTLPLYAEQMTGTAVYAGLVTSCFQWLHWQQDPLWEYCAKR